jgi:hypothetical protein
MMLSRVALWLKFTQAKKALSGIQRAAGGKSKSVFILI